MFARNKIIIYIILCALLVSIIGCVERRVEEGTKETIPKAIQTPTPTPAITHESAEASLPLDVKEELTAALNKISEGWDQHAVNTANRILSNPNYSAKAWEEFFSKYFSQNSFFTDGLRSYLGYPVFAWFSEESHRNLQEGLVNPLTELINRIMDEHCENLSEALDNDPRLLQTLMNAHRFLNTLATGGGWAQGSLLSDQKRIQIYNFYKTHINNYPYLWKSNVTFDPTKQPSLSTIRAQIWMNLRDTLPLTNDRKVEIARIIGLTGRYLEIWNETSILVIDNNGLDGEQLRVILALLKSIPSELHNLGSITVKDFLEVHEKRHLWFETKSSINIFGVKVGEVKENGFPDDAEPKYSDVFSLVLAHEVNHVVDAYYVSRNEKLKQRKIALLEAAGNEHMNYLRSMFEDGFFQQYPQEFFASIANQWFADSKKTIELGLIRFDDGYKHPINQALFFADVYSTGKNFTYFYTIDTKGSITRQTIPLSRDVKGRITSLIIDNQVYNFTLDANGNVIAYQLQRK